MSAFGRAGFGSLNRQNQLRAQGQMDPYGNQVRQAMQPMNMSAYSRQDSVSQSPSKPQQTSSPMARPVPQQAGASSTNATPGTAQAIPPPSQGTAYAPPSPTASQPQTGGPMPTSPGVTQPSIPPATPQTGGPFPTYDDWMSGQGSGGFVNPPTGGPFPTYDSVMGPQTGGPMPTMGQAQPISSAGTGTPYPSSASTTTSKPPIVNPNRPPAGSRPPPARPTIQRPTNQRPMPTMGQAQPISSASSTQERNWYGQMVDGATERFLSMPPGQRTQDYAGNRLMNDLWRASQGSGSAVDFTGRFQEARDQLQQYAVAPPPRRDNETAAETSARLNAETAYGQQQQLLSQIAQQEQREQEFARRNIDYASLPQNQPGYNPYPNGVTLADLYGPNAMQAQYWHRNYNPDGTPRIIGWGGGGTDTPLQPIYGGR